MKEQLKIKPEPRSGVIVVHSGGLDSTVLLYYLLDLGHEVKSLSIDYGQRHRKELDAAQTICLEKRVEHVVADLSGLRPLLAGSALTSPDIEVPEGEYAEENIKVTVVPNRNMIMLAVAASYAINSGFRVVAYAAHAGADVSYPDCRPEFAMTMRQVLALCHFESINLKVPFINLSKSQIVKLGAVRGVPFEKTWSCYKGGEKHCGRCSTCKERRGAFVLADVLDPTEYEE